MFLRQLNIVIRCHYLKMLTLWGKLFSIFKWLSQCFDIWVNGQQNYTIRPAKLQFSPIYMDKLRRTELFYFLKLLIFIFVNRKRPFLRIYCFIICFPKIIQEFNINHRTMIKNSNAMILMSGLKIKMWRSWSKIDSIILPNSIL